MSLIAFDERLSKWAVTNFNSIFNIECSEVSFVPTANENFGDFQCNAAMSLAKTLKISLRDIAQKFSSEVVLPDYVEKVEIAGPGFINVYLKNSALSYHLEKLTNDIYLGINQIGKNKTVIIDYSSPNVAKPMHIGHIRSTVIGNALDRIYRQLGYNVISDNHLGDWGTQFGLMLIGYDEFVDNNLLKINPIEELERIYVLSYNKSKEEPEWRDEAKKALVSLQQGNEKYLSLWKRFIDLSTAEFNSIYKRLDVSFDLSRGESYYNKDLPNIIQKLKDNSLAQRSDGALVVDLEDEGMPVCIVEKVMVVIIMQLLI